MRLNTRRKKQITWPHGVAVVFAARLWEHLLAPETNFLAVLTYFIFLFMLALLLSD